MAGEVVVVDYRIMVFSPQDTPVSELTPNNTFVAVMGEEINGEHYLNLTTTAHLEKEQRVLTQDKTGKWREYVVTGSDHAHDSGDRIFGSYRCVWSLQHDLKLFKVPTENELIGVDSPVGARTALEMVLSGTQRWSVGTVTVVKDSGAAMVQKTCWDALAMLVEFWGGEVDAEIEVGPSGVVSRSVSLYDHLGSAVAKRRFDYARDMPSMRRVVDEMPLGCRIRPYGKSEKDVDGFDVKLTIEEFAGTDYIENPAVVPFLRLPDGAGGWEYPTVDVENSSIEDPEELYEWGESVLEEYTNPKVTYEASVLQYARAGMDVKGVELGDVVQCVDRGFYDGEVRIENRIIKIEVNMLVPSRTTLTLGDKQASYVLSIGGEIERLNSTVTSLTIGADSTAEYLDHLLDHINAEINATGGYTYVTQGQGIRTYDKAVSDPAVGDEAEAVVEVKGGTIRIANSKDAQGQWEWRTVFTSGHIAADVVTAAHITAGTIGNPWGTTFIDLDNNTFRFGGGTLFGDMTFDELAGNVSALQQGLDSEASEREGDIASLGASISDLQGDLTENVAELRNGIDDARRYATDYITYNGHELILGATDSAIKNVMTNSRSAFRTDAGDVAWFGLNDSSIWEMYVETVSVLNRLRFNNFSWYARSNGNMTLRWTG